MANAQILSPERLRMLQRNPDFVTDREVVALAEELAAAKAENAEILNALTALLEAPDDKAVRGLAAMVRDCPSLRAAVFLREYVARRERAEALEAERDALQARIARLLQALADALGTEAGAFLAIVPEYDCPGAAAETAQEGETP